MTPHRSTRNNPDASGREQPAAALPLLQESIEYDAIALRPSWRGWIHLATVPVALVAGVVLVTLAGSVDAKIASAVFALSSIGLFGVSAVYHRFTWSVRTKTLLRRADHANIFLLIAGTYTPIALLALPDEQGHLLLWLVWSGGIVGIALRVFWIGAPRWVYVPLYLLLGWAAIMYLPQLIQVSVAMVVLVGAGGLLYTIGAAVYATKWPNPSAAHFGFHEIFHSLTVLAFACHWTAVLLIAVNPT